LPHSDTAYDLEGLGAVARQFIKRFKVLLTSSLSSFEGTMPQQFHSPVIMARRSHPFPSRTRKLSFSAPMVVGGCPPVRVGHCRALRKTADTHLRFLLYDNLFIS
jgi:hypothetical protein